jgi:hypothetical protein
MSMGSMSMGSMSMGSMSMGFACWLACCARFAPLLASGCKVKRCHVFRRHQDREYEAVALDPCKKAMYSEGRLLSGGVGGWRCWCCGCGDHAGADHARSHARMAQLRVVLPGTQTRLLIGPETRSDWLFKFDFHWPARSQVNFASAQGPALRF